MSHRDGLDAAATLTTFAAAADLAGAAARPLADAVWDRIDSDRWTLEWQLPLWLGEAFGLPSALARDFATSNVLGLAAVRLTDDVADGSIPRGEVAAADALAAVCLDAAFAPYRTAFPAADPFWARVDGWLAEWRAADAVDLAARGRPLRIPALAMCRLARREAAFEELERSLDHLVCALVLYDHAVDWSEDVAAGRWNAFDAAAFRGRAAIARYIGRIDDELAASVPISNRLGVTRLAAHAGSLRSIVAADRERLEARYDALGEASAQLLGWPAAAPA